MVHLLDELHPLAQEVVLPEVTELRACGKNPGPAAPTGPGQVPLQGPGGFHGPEFHPLILGRLSTSWRERGHRAGFATLRAAQRPRTSSPPTRGGNGRALESHMVVLEQEAQREVGGSLQMQARRLTAASPSVE